MADGAVSVAVAITDAAGNTASASTSFDLDTTADLEDGSALSIDTVEGDDVVNDTESTSVDVTINDVNTDAASVEVTLSGTNADDKVVTLTGDGTGTYTATFAGVGDFTDGTLTAKAVVTDTAGNTAEVEKDNITLDTTADSAPDLTVSVDSVINDAASGSVEVTVGGIDGDVAPGGTVTVTLSQSGETDVVASPKMVDGIVVPDKFVAPATSFADEPVTVTLDVTDDAGNPASVSTTFELDTTSDAGPALAASFTTAATGSSTRPSWLAPTSRFPATTAATSLSSASRSRTATVTPPRSRSHVDRWSETPAFMVSAHLPGDVTDANETVSLVFSGESGPSYAGRGTRDLRHACLHDQDGNPTGAFESDTGYMVNITGDYQAANLRTWPASLACS